MLFEAWFDLLPCDIIWVANGITREPYTGELFNLLGCHQPHSD